MTVVTDDPDRRDGTGGIGLYRFGCHSLVHRLFGARERAQAYGYEVDEERAVATIRRFFEGPFNLIDVSNNYGDAERRLGLVLAEMGGLPDGFVLSTKVDRDQVTGRFDGSRVRRSFEESVTRLGLDHLQILYLHDPEHITFKEAVGQGGALEALMALKEEGLVSCIGVAGGPLDLLSRCVATGALDVLMTHSRYTLLDRSAEELIAETSKRGMGVLNAAVMGGGVLAKGVEQIPKYAYRELTSVARDRILEMGAVCSRAGVPLKAAAIQFSLRNPNISSTAIGITRAERIDETLELASLAIPENVWEELGKLRLHPSEWLY